MDGLIDRQTDSASTRRPTLSLDPTPSTERAALDTGDIRVTRSESLDPSHSVRVTRSESLGPSHSVRVPRTTDDPSGIRVVQAGLDRQAAQTGSAGRQCRQAAQTGSADRQRRQAAQTGSADR